MGHNLGCFMMIFPVICIFFPMIILAKREVHISQNTLRMLSVFTAPFSQHELPFVFGLLSFVSIELIEASSALSHSPKSYAALC